MSPIGIWTVHQGACPRCAKVELDKPATLALACLAGTKLAKEAYAAARVAIEKNRRARERVATTGQP